MVTQMATVELRRRNGRREVGLEQKHRVGLKSLMLVAASLIATPALGVDFGLEPATKSLWVTTEAAISGGRIIGEWLDSGSFAEMRDPFSPFSSPKRGLFDGQGPVLIGGQFYVSVDAERFYARVDATHWSVRPAADFLPAGFTCHRHVTTVQGGTMGCGLVHTGVDARGVGINIALSGDSISDASQLTSFYEDGSGLRLAQGPEKWMRPEDDLESVLWLDANNAVLANADSSSAGATVNYTAVTQGGRQSQALTLPGTGKSSMGDSSFVATGGELYFLQNNVDQTSGHTANSIYHIESPMLASARATPLLILPDVSLNSGSSTFRADEHYFYWVATLQLYALDLNTRAITNLRTCNNANFLRSDLPLGQRSPWLACDNQLLELRGGSVHRVLTTAMPVTQGRVLARSGDAVDLAVDETVQYEHFRLDGSKAVLPVTAAAPQVVLMPTWEEGGTVCGTSGGPASSGVLIGQIPVFGGGASAPVDIPTATNGSAGAASSAGATPATTAAGTMPTSSDAAAATGEHGAVGNAGAGAAAPPNAPTGSSPLPAKVLCQRDGQWVERAGGPQPFEVQHAGGKLWALSQNEHDYQLMSLVDATPAAHWQLVQNWPKPALAAGSPVFLPRLLRAGTDQFAVDFGTPEIWVWRGEQLVAGFPHDRLARSFRPALDSEGRLYDVCANPVANALAGPLTYCVYAADGSKTQVSGLVYGPNQEGFGGPLIPLTRGMLIGGYYSDNGYSFGRRFVARGSKAIPLGHLYGQFRDDAGANISVQMRSLGTGAVLISETNFTVQNGLQLSAPIYFRYDGDHLTQLRGRPTQDSDNSGGGSGATSTATIGAPVVTLPGYEPPPEPAVQDIWQGADGLWRQATVGGGAPLYTVAQTALDAAFGLHLPRLNKVDSTTRLGADIWTASDDGLYSCPAANTTRLEASTEELPVTVGCVRRLSLPFLHGLHAAGQQLFFWHGQRLLALTPGPTAGNAGELVEIYRGKEVNSVAWQHSAGAASFTWVEAGSWHRLQLPGKTVDSLSLPPDLQASDVVSTAPQWLCTKRGLYALGAQREWQLRPEMTNCKALVSSATQVLVTDGEQAFVCTGEQCGAPLTPPESYLDDTVLGTSAGGDGFIWLSGERVYALSSGKFNDVTPQIERGSALLTTASSCDEGMVALKGGGMIGVGPRAWHLRLE